MTKKLSKSQAGRVAKRNDFKNAEDLKNAYAPKHGGQFNMHRNTQTGEIILKSIRGNQQISTGLFRVYPIIPFHRLFG